MIRLNLLQKYVRIAALTWAVLSVCLFVLSFLMVRNSGETVQWIHWAYVLGAFVWEDLVFFSLYNFIIAIAVAVTRQYRIAMASVLCFWLIRSIGETIYWFFQQFSTTIQYPHTDYGWNREGWMNTLFPAISDQKWFILHQVSYQAISVLCLLGVFLLFRNWKKLKLR